MTVSRSIFVAVACWLAVLQSSAAHSSNYIWSNSLTKHAALGDLLVEDVIKSPGLPRNHMWLRLRGGKMYEYAQF
jgi:hypothetical protein